VDDKVSFTGLGDVSHREEQFFSNIAEKIPGVGHVVRASSRAYVGFLNKLRADLYKSLVAEAQAVGKWSGPQTGRDIAHFVNVATGRGKLSVLEKAAVPLNTVFFAPRLMASRFETFAMPFYPTLDPFVRKQAAVAAVRLVAVGSTLLGLAALAGAKVVTDPRNADWGKIRVGNTRFDIWGGFQQQARLIAQLSPYKGGIISSTTGKKYTVGGGSISRPGILGRFIRGKLAPTSSFAYDWFKGTDYADKPVTWKKSVLSRSWPLLLQDVSDAYHSTGNPLAAAGVYGIGAFGVGVQTYGKNPPKSAPRARGTRTRARVQRGHDQLDSILSGGGGGGTITPGLDQLDAILK
jgi:hypothetical protein